MWTSFLSSVPSSSESESDVEPATDYKIQCCCFISIHKHKNAEYNTRLMAKIYKFVSFFSHSPLLGGPHRHKKKYITFMCFAFFSFGFFFGNKYNLLLWFRDICTHFYFYVFYDFRTVRSHSLSVSLSCSLSFVIIPIHVQYLNCWLGQCFNNKNVLGFFL